MSLRARLFEGIAGRKHSTLPVLPPSPIPITTKHTYVTTDVFTAESSLGVGVELSSVTPHEMFDLVLSTALGAAWRHNQPAEPNTLAAVTLTGFQLWFRSFPPFC